MTEFSNRLFYIRDEIRAAHEDVLLAKRTAAQRAVDTGTLLLEAQELVTKFHGSWTEWLSDNVQFSERTAQRYMRLACCVAETTDTVSSIADTTQIGAWSEEDILAAAKAIREHRAAGQKARNDALKAGAVPMMTGKYGTIIIDPPWDIQKIACDVRPNQLELDYPTMAEDELATLPIGDIAEDDCHIFCWTTQRFVPTAMRLVERWGFDYTCSFVWHKTGGFQPLGLPQFNAEFVTYGRRGHARFSTTKDFFTCFKAPRREHSRKPDEFYDTIRRVTAGDRRIDIFSREARPGFAQFGNEVGKFGEFVSA